MSSSNRTLGSILIGVGIIGILGYYFDFNFFSMAKLWPLFLLMPGLVFEYAYFAHKQQVGLLVPGGILITLGTVFLFQTYTNWIFAGYCWPFYVLAPAVGLFQLYLFGERNQGLLIPVGILTTVAAFGFLGETLHMVSRSLMWPVAFIVVGIIVLMSKKKA